MFPFYTPWNSRKPNLNELKIRLANPLPRPTHCSSVSVVNLEQRNTDWKWSWPKPIWLLKSWICWKTFIFNQIEEIDSVYDRVFSYHTCVHKKKQWKWLKEPLTFTVIEKWHVYYKIEILPCLGKKPFTGTFLRPAYKINHSKFFTKLRIWW